MDREKVITEIEDALSGNLARAGHVYRMSLNGLKDKALTDALALLKEQQEEHKRMLLWLSKFCRHIDNGDKWLTDEENLEFFREKMKQQFGWADT